MGTVPRTLIVGIAALLVCVGPHSVSAQTITAPEVLAFTNAERVSRDVRPLTTNSVLSAVAATKMADLFARQYFAHEAPTGEDVADLAKSAGYRYLTVGENLALGGFKDSKAVVTAWMNSPGHRKNILNPTYSEIGIAAGRGMYEGRNTWIIVQTFGLPRSVCTEPDAVLRRSIEAREKLLLSLKDLVDLRERAVAQARNDRDAYLLRVASYNRAAEVYNAQVALQRGDIARFNTTVKSFNACVTKKTKS